MKLDNLITETYGHIDLSETEKIKSLIPDGINITKIETNEDPLFGTYFYFKFQPNEIEPKLSSKDSVKFEVDKKGYCNGWFNICKSISGRLEVNKGENPDNEMDENWEGILYELSIHLDAKYREYKKKTWFSITIGQLLENNSFSTYIYDTDIENLKIAEIFQKIVEKFL